MMVLALAAITWAGPMPSALAPSGDGAAQAQPRPPMARGPMMRGPAMRAPGYGAPAFRPGMRGYYPGYRRPYYGGGYRRPYYGWGYRSPYYGWGYRRPYYGWGYGHGDWYPWVAPIPIPVPSHGGPVVALGDYCRTPARICRLYEPAPVGSGCSCRVQGGRSRGRVVE
jgi:hypothetical protein